MSPIHSIPNPDLAVGNDNKQRWNQPAHRRHGFHHAHLLFRRAWMFRSRSVLELGGSGNHQAVGAMSEVAALSRHPAFSALVLAKDDQIIFEQHADDFATTRPHSIQSITKMHIHLIVGILVEQGCLNLDSLVSHYLPQIGSGYARARVQDLLDMNVANDFSEDYADPFADCYTEEIALGWRLPDGDAPEISLRDFVNNITGGDLSNASRYADYKSANTDVLTVICSQVSPVPLAALIEQIVDGAGYEGSFHISVSCDQMPAFSGGGCMSARDLARFGLLISRRTIGVNGSAVANAPFLDATLTRNAPHLAPPKDWLRYSNHLMSDGRWVGHTGYGGQILLVDMELGIACVLLSVLENESGYDDDYMADAIEKLRTICLACN